MLKLVGLQWPAPPFIVGAALIILARIAADGVDAFSCHHHHDSSQKTSMSLLGCRDNNDNGVSSRRDFLVGGIVGAAASSLLFIPPEAAVAAAPITQAETENVGTRFDRLIRPKPPKILRPKLDLKFAVLLMRSSYNALDQLDCVAMDQFQRDFFLIRQAEYEPYVQILGTGFVQQGDLTDPYYFDFISFAQYRAINRELSKDPPFVFEEKQPVDVGEDQPQRFDTVVVRRDPTLTNNMLVPEHSRLVGTMVLDKLDETFNGSGSALPKVIPGSRPDTDTVLASLAQLVKLFLINGFAWDGDAVAVNSSGDKTGTMTFEMSFTSPATIWGGQSLSRDKLQNSFLLKTARVLVERFGYTVVAATTKYSGKTKEVNTLTIK